MSSSGIAGVVGPDLSRAGNGYRKLAIACGQSLLFVLTYYAAFLLWSDFALNATTRWLFFQSVAIVVGIKLVIFYCFGLFRGWWRYVGMSDAVDIVKASACSALAIYLLTRFVIFHRAPRTAIFLDMLLTILVTGGARFAVRAYSEYTHQAYRVAKRTLVVGAGSAGAALVRELLDNVHLEYIPVGFVDDNTSKTGIKIHGITVLGATRDLKMLIAKCKAECVIIAVSRSSGALIDRLLNSCRESSVEFKILPPLSDRLNGPASPSRLVRNICVEDLLGREPVRLQMDEIRATLEGKVLLITGAGGSIGSELCRQVAVFKPRRVVLFERSENDLFKVSRELGEKFPQLDFVPVVGDILDMAALYEVFSRYTPHSVFHAAAYKHVPMMEINCFQAVRNNIFGTFNVAEVARQFRVKDFVMISSDKAVNPTNIMGVTKRVAELVVLGLPPGATRFTAVRFGNVLDSNGSVLPIFREQIAKGGPITVTHPEATRYFMLIPEAVQLVLQASTMGTGNEIFVLDMGEPVRIVDLARNLVRLSAGERGREIEIQFTGLRPGEKLVEELQHEAEQLNPTCHSKIFALNGKIPLFAQVEEWLDALSILVANKDVNGMVEQLKAIVPGYRPSESILELCARSVNEHAHVIKLPARPIAHPSRIKAERRIAVQ